MYLIFGLPLTLLHASGVPKKNGDRHASEICLAALSLRDACQIIDRPDMRNRTIEIRDHPQMISTMFSVVLTPHLARI